MIEYLLAMIIIVACYLLFICYIKPKKEHQAYVKSFQSRGMRVLEIPFKPFGLPLFDQLRSDEKDGDAFKAYKEQYPHYDVVVSNLFNKTLIQVCHPDIIKDFNMKDTHYKYPKASGLFYPFARISFGGGLTLSEGSAWSRKRKIFTKVFIFDMIKNMSGKIASICDEKIQKMEKISLIDEKTSEYDIFKLSAHIFSTVVAECFLRGISE